MKIIKIVATRCYILRLGLCPRPRWGSAVHCRGSD